MTEFIRQFELQIIAVIGALIVGAIKYLFRPRSQLVYSSPHSFTFMIQPNPEQPQFLLRTASVWIRNTGREPATEVELTFNYRPQIYNVWPPRPFDMIDSPDKLHTLKFANIAPKEFLQVELINSNQALPHIVSFRSKEGVGKLIQLRPSPVLSPRMSALLWCLLFVGAATLIYILLLLIAPYVPFLTK